MPALFLLLFGLCSAEEFSDTGRVKPVFKDGKYANPEPVDSSIIPKMRRGIANWLRGRPENSRPAKPLPAQQVDMEQAFPESQSGLYVTWLGHSSLLAQIDGMRILLDPVFANNVSPVPLISVKRFQKAAPASVEELPFIDAVFISHEHYDHLNAEAIIALEPKTGYFLMPSGVGKHLRRWGIPDEKIREYTWWEEGTIQGLSGQTLRFACAPARHFSLRGFFERNSTLWASWVLIGNKHRLFYSGDTSYGIHFKQIGHHYGPFDLTIMENGQYNVNWPYSHIFPEQGVQAHLELKGKYMLPVHWGSFALSSHNWREPIERAVAAADSLGVSLLTPQVGQTLVIGKEAERVYWWREL
jgi:L-ascorbate metabolism protein UlaG (beta-lactamase superfamily)